MTIEYKVNISQTVAILIDGNNIERSIHSESNDTSSMLNIDELVPNLLKDRQLNRMVYFREGKRISEKLKERFQRNYHGSVIPCHKSADIPLTIKATQLASKVDTIIIMSGDSDFVELVVHLKAMGVRVEIAAIKSTTSKYLLDVSDQFHEITKEHWFSINRNRKRNTNKPNHKEGNTNSNPNITQTDEQRLEQSLRDKERNKRIREERREQAELNKKIITNSAEENDSVGNVALPPVIEETEETVLEGDVNGNVAAPVATSKKKVSKKKAIKKVTKKVAKKVTKKATKKVAKKVAKKTTKKATKKVAKKATKKKVAKKVSKKTTIKA